LRLLLDTHIWLWSVLEPQRVAPRVAAELRSQNELWLSPISTWEALVLNAKGRIHLEGDLDLWLSHAQAGMHEAPLTHEIAFVAATSRYAHSDPADRFLAATAKVLGLTLVTADERLLGLGDIPTLANR